MAPKSAPDPSEKKTGPGDQTPEAEKKKDDTTPTPVVDKEVTPSEDDKKKKDTSSTAKKGSTSRTGTSRSGHTQLTELTELSPGREAAIGSMSAGKRKDAVGRGRHLRGSANKMLKKKKHQAIMNSKLKNLRKLQAKKMKGNPRSFHHNIMRILRSVNDSPSSDEAMQPKRVNSLSMMIFDSFANDLCDKISAAAVELIKNTNKRQLGSGEVKAAMKLVLPNDMATCCEEAVQVSLASYRESTKKFQAKIAKAKGHKKAAGGLKD